MADGRRRTATASGPCRGGHRDSTFVCRVVQSDVLPDAKFKMCVIECSVHYCVQAIRMLFDLVLNVFPRAEQRGANAFI